MYNAEMQPMPQPGLREPLRWNTNSLKTIFVLSMIILILIAFWPKLVAFEWNLVFSNGNWWEQMDWLLIGLGLFFLLSATLGANPRHDIPTFFAGIIGGTILEIWGTRAGVWYYYTYEKPPLWILPAWGVSALANERIQRFITNSLPEKYREQILTDAIGNSFLRYFYGFSMSALLAFFLFWSRDYLFHPTTAIVFLLMVTALKSPKFPAYALSLFFSGTLLGVFLEIWGTTRFCWNYYDGKAPSLFPIFGHGIAGLCFWKIKILGIKTAETCKDFSKKR